MILSIQDIYDNVESYRTVNGLSQEKMAELMGLSNKQAYRNMIIKKTMKLRYLVNLVNKTEVGFDKFFIKSINKQPYDYKTNLSSVNDNNVKLYSCPDCIKKQKEIEMLNNQLRDKDELLSFYRAGNKSII